jgi:hypothetical protein
VSECVAFAPVVNSPVAGSPSRSRLASMRTHHVYAPVLNARGYRPILFQPKSIMRIGHRFVAYASPSNRFIMTCCFRTAGHAPP